MGGPICIVPHSRAYHIASHSLTFCRFVLWLSGAELVPHIRWSEYAQRSQLYPPEEPPTPDDALPYALCDALWPMFHQTVL